VGIFPEGRITRTGQIQPFERGFERITQGLEIPAIPVHLDGMYGHPLSCSGGGLFRSWRRVWRPVVDIHVGEPVFGPVSPADLRQRVLDLCAAH
jgi:acyl-[acyl-carrier-protein]-phospholipid O-acyltransferase/long-chain-fatty-acid--[acyl-carrier-protein] ligase